MFMKLKESGLSFDKLWGMLPPYIRVNNINYWLRLEKLKRYDRISYYASHGDLLEPIIIEFDNSEIETITLSNLAAEMLIEIKKRGLR